MGDYENVLPKVIALELVQCFRAFCVSGHNAEDYENLARFSHLVNRVVFLENIDIDCNCHNWEISMIDSPLFDSTMIEKILTDGQCIHYRHVPEKRRLGFFPIHIAAGYGDIGLLNYCLKYGSDIYAMTLCGNSYPFEIAVFNKHYEAADFLLIKGFTYLSSPLLLKKEMILVECIFQNQLEGAMLCQQAGLKVCPMRWEQLMIQAVDQSHAHIVKWLLDMNIGHANDTFKQGFPVLYYAKTEGVTELLLQDGADPCVVVDPVGTPLMLHIKEKQLAVVECILKFNPAIVNFMVTEAPDEHRNYYSALHYSAWHGYAEGVKLLCRYGADHRLITYCGNTVLSLACHSASLPCVEILLSLGCDVNHADKDGDTALLYATCHGNYDIVKALLEQGANPSLSNTKGTSPLWNAVDSRSLESVNMLLSMNVDAQRKCQGQSIYDGSNIYDVPVSPLFVAIHHEDVSIAKALTAAGCYIAGEKFSTTDFDRYIGHWAEDNKRWFEHIMSTPPTLAWWCKRSIRSALLPVKPNLVIKALPIPTSIKKYISEI